MSSTVITPSALFTHARVTSPKPSKFSNAQSINQPLMLGTPPYTFQSFPTNTSTNQPFFHSPGHTFVLPYVATAPPLALDESVDDDEWLNDYDGSKTPDFMEENNPNNASSPYFPDSDLSTISDDRSVDSSFAEQIMEENEMMVQSNEFAPAASIFAEPHPIILTIKESINPPFNGMMPIELPPLEAVPESPVVKPVSQPTVEAPKSVASKSSAKKSSSSKSSKSTSSLNVISSSQSVVYPSAMSRSLAIVKGTRSYSDLQSLKKSKKKSSSKRSMSHKTPGKFASSKGPRQASGQGEGNNQQQQQQQQSSDANQAGQQSNQSNGQQLPTDLKTPGKRGSGGKRKRGDSSDEGSDGDSSGDEGDHMFSSSSEEEDENGKKVKKDKSKSSKKRLKSMSKRERNKLSAKAYRQRKKNATCQLSEKNAALQRFVDQQSRLLADQQLETARIKEQMSVLQTLLSIKVNDLWQSRPAPPAFPATQGNQQATNQASGAPFRPAQSSPLAPTMPSLNSAGGILGASPDGSGFPNFMAPSGERSALALREGEDLKSGVLNQRTGMFLLALFSCFLLFNPGHRQTSSLPPGTTATGAEAGQTTGVLNTLAEAAIKSESDTSPMGIRTGPIVHVKNEPLTPEQMAAYLAQASNQMDPSLLDPAVRIPLVVDAQGLLHEWLVTADEQAMAQLRALTYEPLVYALGPEIANRAIREFAASFAARQLD